MKTCSKCGEEKEMNKFYNESRRKDGKKNVCKVCCEIKSRILKQTSAYKEKKKGWDSAYKVSQDVKDWKRRRKRARVKHIYGITLERYEEYLSKPCAICGKDSEVLDHCHASLKIRGGLCQACNKLLGCARDNIHILRKAATYLKENFNESD